MSEIKWQEPPGGSRTNYRTKYDRVGDELRANPGRWALIGEGKAGTSNANYAQRVLGAEFEVVSRTSEDRGFDIYARFVGEVTR